jgi:hypothetical protein
MLDEASEETLPLDPQKRAAVVNTFEELLCGREAARVASTTVRKFSIGEYGPDYFVLVTGASEMRRLYHLHHRNGKRPASLGRVDGAEMVTDANINPLIAHFNALEGVIRRGDYQDIALRERAVSS